MYSVEFKALRSRLAKLSKALPSASLSKQSLTASQEERIIFFAIAAHATCEEFMEQRALSAAQQAYDTYANSQFLGRVAKHLLIMPFLNVPNDSNDLRKLTKVIGLRGVCPGVSKSVQTANPNEVMDLLHLGFQRFRQTVSSNHGMSIKYQFALLAVLGFDLNQLDPSFKSRVSQLATLRGEGAHKSVVAAKTIPEPSDLSKWTTDLILGYRQMDVVLRRLGRLHN
jgi:hypothetical protein